MAVCGNCGRLGTVAEIRRCFFNNKPHGEGEGKYMPKVLWGDEISAQEIDDAPESQGGSLYEGPLPPNGVYTFVIQKIQATKSSTDKPMVAIRWAIDGATGDKAVYNGAPWWDNIVVGKSTLWKVKSFTKATGITSADFMKAVTDDEDNILKFGTKKTEGMKVRARVIQKPGNDGNMRLDFGAYFPPKGDEEATAEAEAAPATEGKKSKKDKAGKKGKKGDDAPPF